MVMLTPAHDEEFLSNSAIRDRARKLRQEAGLSMRQLADRIGDIHFTTLGKLESGKVSFSKEHIAAYARGLNLTPFELLASELGPANFSPVPLFDVLELISTDRPSRRNAVAFVPSPLQGEDLIAVSSFIQDDVHGELQYRVYNYAEREILDSNVYLLKLDGGAVYEGKFDKNAVRFVPIDADSGWEELPVGSVPFRVLGTAIFEGKYL